MDRRAELLAVLRAKGAPRWWALQTADTIHPAMLEVLVESTSRGHEIGSFGTAFYARARTKPRGPARDLRDLQRAACKAITRALSPDPDWIDAWARIPAKTRRLIQLPKRVLTKDGRAIDYMGFSAPGFSIIAPGPALALPRIEAALRAQEKTPGSRRRTSNQVEDHARALIWRAFQAGDGAGVRTTAFLEFGRTVDAIYGTALFAAKDGRHLRRLI